MTSERAAEYKKGSFIYRSSTEGDITSHAVKEYIYENGMEAYSAVIGGLIDRNARGAM